MLRKHRKTKSDTDSLFPKNNADYLLNLLIQEKDFRLIQEYILDKEKQDPFLYWQVMLIKHSAREPKTNRQWHAISAIEYAAITKNEYILKTILLANLPNDKAALTQAIDQLEKINDPEFLHEIIESLKNRSEYYFKP